MNDAFAEPGRTGRIPAPGDRFVRQARDLAPACRTARGQPICPLVPSTTLLDHLYNVRYDVSRPFDQDRITDPNILAIDLILVMQRDMSNFNTADVHRFERSDWRQSSGTSDIGFNVLDTRALLKWWKLPRYGPTRVGRARSKTLLSRQAIELENATVDLVGKPFTAAFHLVKPINRLVERLEATPIGVRFQTESLHQLQAFPVRVGTSGRCGRHFPNENMERPLRSDSRIELPQAPRSGIARIGECLCAKALLMPVELLEFFLVHVDFAAQDELPGSASTFPLSGRKPQRNLAYGFHVDGDVFAAVAIAARGSGNQISIVVNNLHASSVVLRFTDQNALCFAQLLTAGLIETPKLVFVPYRLNAEHRSFMADRNKTFSRLASDSLGRAVRRD